MLRQLFFVSVLMLWASYLYGFNLSYRSKPSTNDSLIRVWGKLQRVTYFKGQYHESVMYFDSLLEQQGVRINYVSLRIGLYCAKKAGLERDFNFGERLFGPSIMSHEWHPLQINANEKLHYQASDPPVPPGGIKQFERYIKKNLCYPVSALKDNLEGTVEVQFVINKDGTIGGACVLKGISRDCNQEAERVIRNSPRWKPAEMHGKVVYYRMIYPVHFKLPKKAQKIISQSE